MTIKEQLRRIHGAESFYKFVNDPKNGFVETHWNRYQHPEGTFILFSFDSVGNVTGCRVYC